MDDLKIVCLAGGVGGAKLADGLAQVLQPEHLTIIVNTGDDFSFLGLMISPDLDTVCYTLAGLANPETGWGRNHETWHVYEHLRSLGMPDWFQLGDADLATHLFRTVMLNEGKALSQITGDLCRIWGVCTTVLPMSNDVIQTRIISDQGELDFQEYFVHRQCKPITKGIRFDGIAQSKPAPGVLEAIFECDAVVICPSNPWVSIDPILSIPGVQDALLNHPIYAVSPIIGNTAVKGPAAKMFSELGIQPSALAVAQHYIDFIDYFAVDSIDVGMVHDINKAGIRTLVTDILMRDKVDRGRLAHELVNFIRKNMKR